MGESLGRISELVRSIGKCWGEVNGARTMSGKCQNLFLVASGQLSIRWCLPELLPQRIFQKTSASLAYSLKLINGFPLCVTQAVFKLLHLCWDSE